MSSAIQVQAAHSASPIPQSVGGTAEVQMLVMMVQAQLVQGDVAKSCVDLSEQQLKELREQVREALEKAREAEEDSGFFGAIGDVLGGDIATLAGLVVIAAASVATGGAAAVVLGAIAIGCTLASKYADELGIPPNVAIGLGIAAAVATVASGNVGGLANAAGSTAAGGTAAGSSVAAGAGSAAASAGAAASASAAVSGGASALGAANHVSRLAQVAEQVRFYADIVAPVATGAGAVAHGVAGGYRSAAIHHNADAQEARSKETLESMDIDTAIDLFERTIDRQLGAATQTLGILQANQRSKDLILQSFQGVA